MGLVRIRNTRNRLQTIMLANYKRAFGSVKQSPFVYMSWTWSIKR